MCGGGDSVLWGAKEQGTPAARKAASPSPLLGEVVPSPGLPGRGRVPLQDLKAQTPPASLTGRGEQAACVCRGPRSSTIPSQTAAMRSWSPALATQNWKTGLRPSSSLVGPRPTPQAGLGVDAARGGHSNNRQRTQKGKSPALDHKITGELAIQVQAWRVPPHSHSAVGQAARSVHDGELPGEADT